MYVVKPLCFFLMFDAHMYFTILFYELKPRGHVTGIHVRLDDVHTGQHGIHSTYHRTRHT